MPAAVFPESSELTKLLTKSKIAISVLFPDWTDWKVFSYISECNLLASC